MLAHILVIVVALLNTHLWSFRVLTTSFTRPFLERWALYFETFLEGAKAERKSPLGLGSVQSISLHRLKACGRSLPPNHCI